MIRIVVMVLAATNVLYFGWSRWVDQGKPELTEVARTTDRQQTTAPPSPPPPPPCAALGPFLDPVLAESAGQQLAKAGWVPERRDASSEVSEGWWVYVPNANGAGQVRTVNAIRRAGLTDAFAMPDDPGFRVSVGIFSDESRAEDVAARVQRLRLEAVVTERRKLQVETWFDIPGVAREALGDGRLAQTGLPLERLRIEDCPARP